ncbi:scavenger receptor class B member 1 isoform X2 [Episyrphus balteatus]|uniref:scavenger receptor class B member 1 isoform X2 n=1 Tax=Episyrphus balteatus TaxID=286459 RepID=UPI002485B50F|nr:scavenger receptor class B member 1 isoform X2 [Episyrphus balteatus]
MLLRRSSLKCILKLGAVKLKALNPVDSMQPTNWKRIFCAFLLLLGGLLAITGAVLVKIFQPYDLIFKWKLVFEEGGEIFGLWEKPPVDLYLKVYLFNITNAEAFLAGREKMNVEEVGPYVYKELMTHENVTFNENGTVSAIPRHPLVWQEELSGGRREDDAVYMLNIAMLSIAQVASDKSFFVRFPVNVMLANTDSTPIVKMTAREFMFGYKSSITTLGNTFLPGWIYFDKVGLIDRMYDFDTDYETFHTGVDDPSISGLYATYRGSPDLPQWDGHHCSNINMASDGTKFKSFIQPNDSVLFFRKSMCRPQNLIRTGDEVIRRNLAGYKYVFEDNAMDNGEIEEKNKCYCRQGYCQPRGLIDVTDCYYGFPISLSYPHFMDTDPGLMNNVTGLKPNRSEHSSYFILQPDSGLPLEISVKIQINMHMRNVRNMNKVAQFSDLTFPMLWFEITMMELPDTLANRFNFYLNYLPYIDYLGFWGGLLLGMVFLFFAITRATIRLSHFKRISESGKSYAKANLRSGVYNPCEMKLMQTNEKMPMAKQTEEIKADRGAMIYDVDLKAANTGSYMLEDEPAMSDVENDDGDDGNASDSSSRSSSSSDIEDDYMTDETRSIHNGNASDEQATTKSLSSSDFASTSATSEDQQKWPIGETALLIDDVDDVVEDLPPLRIEE